jgi:hypothetical protein
MCTPELCDASCDSQKTSGATYIVLKDLCLWGAQLLIIHAEIYVSVCMYIYV